MPKYLIKVQYFKTSGKYYASGEYETTHELMHNVFEEFEDMLKRGKRPGLVNGHSGFTAVLNCNRHPMGFPGMFINKA